MKTQSLGHIGHIYDVQVKFPPSARFASPEDEGPERAGRISNQTTPTYSDFPFCSHEFVESLQLSEWFA